MVEILIVVLLGLIVIIALFILGMVFYFGLKYLKSGASMAGFDGPNYGNTFVDLASQCVNRSRHGSFIYC